MMTSKPLDYTILFRRAWKFPSEQPLYHQDFPSSPWLQSLSWACLQSQIFQRGTQCLRMLFCFFYIQYLYFHFCRVFMTFLGSMTCAVRVPLVTILTLHHGQNQSKKQEKIKKRETMRLREVQDAQKRREKRRREDSQSQQQQPYQRNTLFIE